MTTAFYAILAWGREPWFRSYLADSFELGPRVATRFFLENHEDCR